MSHSFHERRLGQRSFQPRQRHVGARGSRGAWLVQLYTPRWRYHLAVLLVALSIIPIGWRSTGGLRGASAAARQGEGQLQTDARPAAVRYHQVAEGESLQSIAEQYGLSPDTIRWANGLGDLDPIVIGQELVILPADGVLHYLAAGETARQVALYYGADPDQVAAYNGVGDPDRPLQATELMVPGGRPRPSQAVASLGPVSWVSMGPADDGDRPEGSSLLQFGDRTLVVVEDSEHVEAARTAAAAPARTWEEIQQEAERATAAALAASKHKAPAPIDYEVQPGDTLNGLADRYGVTPLTIIAANGLLNSDALRVGQSLVIPPVTGVIYRVQDDDTLSEIAQRFRVDLGPIVDYNALDDANTLAVGQRLIIPGAEPERPKPPPPPPTPAPARPAAPASVSGGMTPAGFDCSGFVYYVHRQTGIPLSRGMMGQFTAGPHISKDELQPGDIVFFSNTYMPGLSHDGIYIGGGKFIHASDESTGVTITSLSSAYWASRYSGATRAH